MNSFEGLSIALRALRANKIRSFLTLLGVLIGVAAVVTIVGVGAGAQERVAQQIRSLGANVLMIMPSETQADGVRMARGTGHTLSEADAASMAREIPYLIAAAPSVRGNAQAIAGNRNWNTGVNGTTKDYFTIREWGLAAGRYFSDRETQGAGKVALIGRTVREELFEEKEDPIGQRIRIGNVPFEVVGVLAEKGPSGSGRDQDDIIFVPITTAKLRLMGAAHQVDRASVAYILAKATSSETMDPAMREIKSLLRRNHNLSFGQDDDFEVSNPAAAMSAQRSATQTVAWLLAAVASVSLIVGGVSIMNIMLVSVTERKREIGLRLALGARQGDIRNQFLIEALTLCLLGGLLGIAFGIGAAMLIGFWTNWPILISPSAIAVAVLFAGSVGLFFGYFPARRAAGLNPIECLRSE